MAAPKHSGRQTGAHSAPPQVNGSTDEPRNASGKRVVHLNVRLNRSRDVPGSMTVVVDGVEIAEFAVLGRGTDDLHPKDHSPAARQEASFRQAWRHSHGSTWELQDGDTPLGTYDGVDWESTSRRDKKSYGPNGAIRLKPLGGDALIAHDQNGRDGLLIHGGAPGRYKGLNATHGCLRISNTDVARLNAILDEAANDEQRRVCEWPEVRVTLHSS